MKMQPKIHELEKFRDQRHLFEDRAEAGKTLGLMLQTEVKKRWSIFCHDRIERRNT
jgi:hypothetical protein